MNLLVETKTILAQNGKSLDDVVWVGSTKNKIHIERFIELADIEYDDEYGSPEVAQNLLIVGGDFWLERHEYDGSEWWEFKQMPQPPNSVIANPTALTVGQARGVSCGWESLERLNGVGE